MNSAQDSGDGTEPGAELPPEARQNEEKNGLRLARELVDHVRLLGDGGVAITVNDSGETWEIAVRLVQRRIPES